MTDNTDYIPRGTFIWIMGTVVLIGLSTCGFLYGVASDGVNRARNNEVVIATLSTQLEVMNGTLVEIKDILREE